MDINSSLALRDPYLQPQGGRFRAAGESLMGLGADLGMLLAPGANDPIIMQRVRAMKPALMAAEKKLGAGTAAKMMPAIKMGARFGPALGAAGTALGAADILLSDTTASNKAMDAAGMGLGAAIGGGLGLLTGGALSPVGAMVGSSIGKMGSDAIQGLMGWDKQPQPKESAPVTQEQLQQLVLRGYL